MRRMIAVAIDFRSTVVARSLEASCLVINGSVLPNDTPKSERRWDLCHSRFICVALSAARRTGEFDLQFDISVTAFDD